MNKYQEALDYLRRIGGDGYYKKQREKSFDVLQELVDKEIPMKLVGDMYHRRCRLCGNQNLNTKWTYGNYCSGCGQRVLWED